MTDEERYFFDLKGYLVLRNVLSAEHVAALNAMIDRVETRPDEPPAAGAVQRTARAGHLHQQHEGAGRSVRGAD